MDDDEYYDEQDRLDEKYNESCAEIPREGDGQEVIEWLLYNGFIR